MIAEHAIDWTKPWREEGVKEGRKKGRREGRKEGRLEGEIAVLTRMLTRRFGALDPALEERIRSADSDQLLDWCERFVTATDLDEIFNGGRSD